MRTISYSCFSINNGYYFRSSDASWHADYRDTAYIYIGGLPFELSEGDIMTIFSQFGEPTYVNLVRDKETGKSRGFAFLKYEDQRSTDLAVDNLGGITVMGRTLRVDHTRYKKKEDEPEEESELKDPGLVEGHAFRKPKSIERNNGGDEPQRPMLKEERELALLLDEHDDDDPMKDFLIQEKREEVAKALARLQEGKPSDMDQKSRHRHRHSHRSLEKNGSSEIDSHSRRHKEQRRTFRSKDRSRDRGDHEKRHQRYHSRRSD
jgi:RNA-binding motif X-linked protein 2